MLGTQGDGWRCCVAHCRWSRSLRCDYCSTVPELWAVVIWAPVDSSLATPPCRLRQALFSHPRVLSVPPRRFLCTPLFCDTPPILPKFPPPRSCATPLCRELSSSIPGSQPPLLFDRSACLFPASSFQPSPAEWRRLARSGIKGSNYLDWVLVFNSGFPFVCCPPPCLHRPPCLHPVADTCVFSCFCLC